jgi:hypothetical protein
MLGRGNCDLTYRLSQYDIIIPFWVRYCLSLGLVVISISCRVGDDFLEFGAPPMYLDDYADIKRIASKHKAVV